MSNETKIMPILSDIAKEQLNIETLETRNSDSLDFHEVSVWAVKCALKIAFDAGLDFHNQQKGE